MALRTSNIFVNLPIKDLKRTTEFFSSVGFEFNPQFTDEKATCMVIGDNIFAMLLVEEYFATFTKKDLANAHKTTEVILALSAESREQVDAIVDKALAAGGKASNEPQDHGFMYVRSFEDIDGHQWEVMWMDPSAIQG
ncbi:VOC family protein [Paenibacillus sp.]|uniref:VOC family protein n=1 Tax=Paenibacillus sp. TaxID=58172 RepID=UPI002811266B|nr:VOC family protein [Paenibacillus sp.]